MSVRNGLVLLVALSALTFLVACGGGNSPAPVAPPSGGFSNSNLSGSYVFSTTGQDSSGLFLAMTGTLAASGGTITGGTVDIWGLDFQALAQPITKGSYKVTTDGRGQIVFTTTVNTVNAIGTPVTTPITFTLDLVLISNSHGFVTEFDSNGTGSGTIDLQTTVSQAQLAGSFAFGLSGVGNTASPSLILEAGALTLDSTGAVTAGQEDINNAGLYSGSADSIEPTVSTVTLGTAQGAATLAVTGVDTYTFDIYPIDTTHFKLIETDGKLLTSGDAYTQATSIPAGQLVFTMAGEDTSAAPVDLGGWLTNGSGTISAGLEDFNDAGNVSPPAGVTGIAGSFTPLTGGRAELGLTGFVNGAASDVPGSYTFAAYPFTYSGGSGIQLLEIDDAGVTSGVAYPQGAATLAASEGYGLNLSGFNSVEEDDIAEFTTASTSFSGLADLNDESQLTFDKALTGTLTAPDGNGRGAASSNFFNFNFYVVDSSTVLLLETDTTQVGLGAFEQQSGSGAAAAARPASLLRPVMHPHTARSKQK